MTKMADHDLTKESIPMQEFSDEVTKILNNGLYEIQVTTASQPAFDAPDEPTLVLSIFGAQYRFYVGYNGVWYYATLTAV